MNFFQRIALDAVLGTISAALKSIPEQRLMAWLLVLGLEADLFADRFGQIREDLFVAD